MIQPAIHNKKTSYLDIEKGVVNDSGILIDVSYYVVNAVFVLQDSIFSLGQYPKITKIKKKKN
jgi:hypothetical protein